MFDHMALTLKRWNNDYASKQLFGDPLRVFEAFPSHGRTHYYFDLLASRGAGEDIYLFATLAYSARLLSDPIEIAIKSSEHKMDLLEDFTSSGEVTEEILERAMRFSKQIIDNRLRIDVNGTKWFMQSPGLNRYCFSYVDAGNAWNVQYDYVGQASEYPGHGMEGSYYKTLLLGSDMQVPDFTVSFDNEEQVIKLSPDEIDGFVINDKFKRLEDWVESLVKRKLIKGCA